MNASSVLRYFINKNKLLLNTSQISQMANKIGSDVMLGIEKKTRLKTVNSSSNSAEKVQSDQKLSIKQ